MEPLEQPEQLESLLAGYVLGDLTPEEAAGFHQLLESNPELADEVRCLKTTLALLPLSLPSTLPPQGLQSRILNAAQGAEDISHFRSTRRTKTVQWTWFAALGSVAAVLVAGLGFGNYRLHQELASTQTALRQSHQKDLTTAHNELSRYREVVNLLRQPNNRFLTLRGTSSESVSSGSLVIAPKSDAAILVLQDVAPLPEGKVYRMWAFVDGQKVSCADFKPNAKGEVFLQLPLDKWGGTTEVVVTVEPAQEIPNPVGEMVMTGS